MKATTPEEKRELAAHLEKYEPELLEFLKIASKEFGLLDAVIYERRGN